MPPHVRGGGSNRDSKILGDNWELAMSKLGLLPGLLPWRLVKELAYPGDQRAEPAGDRTSVWSKHAGRLSRSGIRLKTIHSPPYWGLGTRLTTSSFKNKHVRQISQNLSIPDFQGDASLLNNTCAC